MALQPTTDLLIVYRPDDQKHYNIAIDDLPGEEDGSVIGQILKWDGTDWKPSLEIDCGAKDVGNGGVDYPD